MSGNRVSGRHGAHPQGRFVPTLRGARAFVPEPLPPRIEFTRELVRCLSDADSLLGRLAGEGRRLPNPHVLIRPFVRREAVLSSRIEGTEASLGELLAAEAGVHVERSPETLREVGNYVVALEHGIRRLRSLPLSIRLVRELHRELMRGVGGERAALGELRRAQNWIGRPGCDILDATYVPPPPGEIADCLASWEESLHDESWPPLVQIALAHYQFEAIHPFLDGNGRVGRLLIPLFLIARGLLPAPLLYVSAFFEASRPDYYSGLRGVTEHGEWREWVLYFLGAVALQSEDALSRSARILSLLDRWRVRISGARSARPLRLLDLVGENPFWTARGAARRLDVSFATAQRAIARLERAGILRQVSPGRRDRVYCARALLDILEEPPLLDRFQEPDRSRSR